MSKKPKLTPWFSLSTPPARPGAYEIEGVSWGGPCFSFFDGKHWNGGYETPDHAASSRSKWGWLNEDNKPRAVWRGLAENPAPGATPGDAKP